MRAILVHNPRSGTRDAGRRDAIVAWLGPSLDLAVHDADEVERIEALARDAVSQGVELVIAAGGDGTVSACAGAVIGTEAALAIVPCGTANSIARALDLPADVEGACRAIASGGVRRIDAARVNGRPMVLLASIGLHADTIESASGEAKAALGKLAYVLSGIARLAELESFSVRIETERGGAELRAVALTIANVAPPQSIFARGAPDVVPDDGLLDMTLATAETPLEAATAAIELALAAASGTEARSRRVGWARCTRAHVIADPPQQVLVDGDVIGTTPMLVEVVPRGLAVRVPLAASLPLERL